MGKVLFSHLLFKNIIRITKICLNKEMWYNINILFIERWRYDKNNIN